jgi:hypothetical protein
MDAVIIRPSRQPENLEWLGLGLRNGGALCHGETHGIELLHVCAVIFALPFIGFGDA